MRTIEINNQEKAISGIIAVPDYMVFAFNPNYIELNLTNFSGLIELFVSDVANTYRIEVSLFNGYAKCYISQLIQVLFNDYVSIRSKEITIKIATSDDVTLATISCMAFWASVGIGMKYGHYMPFTYNGNNSPKYIREVIWFKKLPFRVSLYRMSTDFNLYAQSDKEAIKSIWANRNVTWVKDATTLNAGVTAKKVAAGNVSNVQLQTINTGLLKEAGLTANLSASGFSNVVLSGKVALQDVEVFTSSGNIIDWNHYVETGLDIISYNSIFGGKTGIFELSPIDMFPSTERRLTYTVMLPSPQNAKFDADFDIVFNEITDLAYIVKLTVCDDMDGIYLRWIDQYGFWQYFLFDKGVRTSKNELDSTAVDDEYEKDGLYYPVTRNIHVDNTDTQKCCAINLRKEILAYVETIYKSPHIDLFLGYDIDKNEMWIPVNIVKGSVNIEANNNLYDYEISVTLPDTVSQTI